jgi:cytochrome c553
MPARESRRGASGLAGRGSRIIAALWSVFTFISPALSSDDERAVAANPRTGPAVPSWLFPSDPAAPIARRPDPNERLGLSGSAVTFTRAQLTDRYSAPDWHPGEHDPMPEVVAHGRGPDVYACGYCHTPTGQGRPENAPLAGLPVAYIEEQVAAFASGTRRSAWAGTYGPAKLMVQVAEHASQADVAAAADYFSRQKLGSRVRVVETARVPQSEVVGQVYSALAGAGEEELGERLMEFSPSAEAHELRDDRMQYLAYVPVGSVARGRRIATRGVRNKVNACVMCHGPQLQGVGPAPPIAGRSPTYLLRSLFAFQVGRRSGGSAVLMQPIAAGLNTRQMIEVAAYAASLPPPPRDTDLLRPPH